MTVIRNLKEGQKVLAKVKRVNEQARRWYEAVAQLKGAREHLPPSPTKRFPQLVGNFLARSTDRNNGYPYIGTPFRQKFSVSPPPSLSKIPSGPTGVKYDRKWDKNEGVEMSKKGESGKACISGNRINEGEGAGVTTIVL